MKFQRTLLASFLFITGSLLQADSLDDFLKKARAQLGPEKALENVESIQYIGEVTSAEGQKMSDLELIFEKPNCQKLKETRGDKVNQTAVNGFEGYVMSMDTANPSSRVIQVLRPLQVKRLMANAVENLNFFTGPEHMRGAEIIDEGVTEYNGKKARKIKFQYPLELYYVRYFEPDTGKLIATVSSDGLTMVEKESLEANGIKFPKTVDTYDETGKLLRSVVFTQVKVNEKIPPTAFDFPK
ncbi:hypothetical protein [Cerasicoccus fimbriatus]|uniref:hypothetical protein n=1 Tax=Cerasicoccus fimbriatus TaxID=3014554 RepID=UPI0022B4F695|nr:hypothetical protein [Cerasicoccus sp. TK19100]